MKSTDVVRGVYVPTRLLQSAKWTPIEQALTDRRLTAVVLDIKGDSGKPILPAKDPAVLQMGTEPSQTLLDKIKQLNQKGIYTIARIVTFKDPYVASMQPELSIHTKSGKVWADKKGVSWIDPFARKGWDYNLALAETAAKQGFDEVQFDYVRFPENGAQTDREVTYHSSEYKTKADAIAGFLQAAKQRLAPYQVAVSADVFGMTTSTDDDMGIGQNWRKIAEQVDIICPMIYPSHYGKGVYGISNPDLQPYRVVQQAMKDAIAKNASLPSPAKIRPWLQDFTASWIKPHQDYREQEVAEQIKALREIGIDQFLLWSSNAHYHIPSGDLS